jgi:hypothetical protein
MPAYVVAQPLPQLIPYTNGKLWGFADTNGHVVITPQWANVDLFKGDKAIVTVKFNETNPSQDVYALINTDGSYIIPPSRNWNGTFAGWEGQLNAYDANNNWGMIDTFNNVLIPFEWQPAWSSIGRAAEYKVVARNGMAGVINRQNELIIPCRYREIFSCCGLEKLNAFMVVDTGEPRQPNIYGVLDTHNNMLLPMKYHDIYYREWKGMQGFQATQAHRDTYIRLFIDLQTGKEMDYDGPSWDSPPQDRWGKYILSRTSPDQWQLLDSNHKVVLSQLQYPGYQLYHNSKDTIILSKSTVLHKNAEEVTYAYLDANTFTSLSPAKKIVYYIEETRGFYPPEGVCGNGVNAWRNAMYRERSLPQVNYEGRLTKRFYKDSILWRVTGRANVGRDGQIITNIFDGNNIGIDWRPTSTSTNRDNYILINGNATNGHDYCAIVDENCNYIVQPINNEQIYSYNIHDGLVSTTNGTVYGKNGKKISQLKHKELRGAYVWYNKVYTFIASAKTDQLNNRLSYTTEVWKIADDTGALIPAVSPYTYSGSMIQNEKPFAIALSDSNNRIGLFLPNGESLCPEVNFKYQQLNLSSDSFILARDSVNQPGSIIDLHNKKPLGNLLLASLSPVLKKLDTCYYQKVSEHQYAVVNGLYLAARESPDEPNKTERFYIDRSLRVYRQGLMKESKHRTSNDSRHRKNRKNNEQ